jgi:hypothetical protein
LTAVAKGGYLVTGPDLLINGMTPASWPLERAPYYLETAVPGSFAAGDVRHRSIKRVATAAGEGAMAIAFVYRYLEFDCRRAFMVSKRSFCFLPSWRLPGSSRSKRSAVMRRANGETRG